MIFQQWFVKLLCRLFGHPGVFRQWEWLPTAPQWKLRVDAWTCIRCESDVMEVASNTICYVVDRPQLDSPAVDLINRTIDSAGIDHVRVRAGDPNTRRLPQW